MLTDGPYIGDPPTVLQSADVNELNRALAQAQAEIARLVVELSKEEQRHMETIAERDGSIDAFDEVATALGVETEYSNVRCIFDVKNDVDEAIADGKRALAQRDERIAALEAALRQIAETTFDRYAGEIAVNALADPCTGKAEGRTDTERLDRIEAWIKNRWAFIEIDTDRAAFNICGSMHKEPCHAGEVKEETLRAAIDAAIDAAMEVRGEQK